MKKGELQTEWKQRILFKTICMLMFENWNGMCEFIEKDHLPKQTQEEIENLSSPISLKKFSQ